jgi:protein tyrosine phosphatase (PTP) superfamily phosphohydrolase (DUF442 family)
VQLVAIAAAGVTRLQGHDPRVDDSPVPNLRVVANGVWAGGQPDGEGYRALADMGVAFVVDLRTGASDDPREDDPVLLRALGMHHVVLPVKDGHAASRATVDAVRALVDRPEGDVFVHCGAGVGRSSALQASLSASLGDGVPVPELLAVGPVSLEQLWVAVFASEARPVPVNPVVRRLSEALDAPRRALSRVRALF